LVNVPSNRRLKKLLLGITLAGAIAIGANTSLLASPTSSASSTGVPQLLPAPPVAAPSPPQLHCTLQVNPSQSLSQVVAQAPANSTFCLASGTYHLSSTVEVKSNDSFVGQAANRPVVNVGSALIGFDATSASNVVVENLAIENAQTTSSKVTGGCGCVPTGGIGMEGSLGLTVFNTLFQGNEANGFRYPGATVPFLVVGSQFIDNGSQAEVGFTSGGLKVVGPGSVLNSYFANNIGQGIWCDVGCDGGADNNKLDPSGPWTIEGNTVINNTQGGIRYEISDAGALIKDNVVRDNGGLGGIQIASAGNATVEGNTAEGNHGGDIGVTAASARGNGKHAGLGVRKNDLIEGNTVGSAVRGCTLSGVTCTDNTVQ